MMSLKKVYVVKFRHRVIGSAELKVSALNENHAKRVVYVAFDNSEIVSVKQFKKDVKRRAKRVLSSQRVTGNDLKKYTFYSDQIGYGGMYVVYASSLPRAYLLLQKQTGVYKGDVDSYKLG